MTSSRCNQADSRRAPGQWETSLQSNAVSYCLGANLESALVMIFIEIQIAYSQVVWAKTDHVGCGVRTCTPVYSEDYDIMFPWAVYTVCNYGPMWVTTAIVVSWWRHQMETFSALLALWEGNPPFTGGFPSQRPVTRSFEFFSSATQQTVEQTTG